MKNEVTLCGRITRVAGWFDDEGRLAVRGWVEVPHPAGEERRTKIPFRVWNAEEEVLEYEGKDAEIRGALGWSKRPDDTFELLVSVLDLRLVRLTRPVRPAVAARPRRTSSVPRAVARRTGGDDIPY